MCAAGCALTHCILAMLHVSGPHSLGYSWLCTLRMSSGVLQLNTTGRPVALRASLMAVKERWRSVTLNW